MADDDDEFGFADDLDELPGDQLRELETQAFLSTQHRSKPDAPPAAPAARAAANTHSGAAHAPHAAPPPSDYDFDEDVINLDDDVAVAAQPINAAASRPLTQPRFGGKPPVPARNVPSRQPACGPAGDGSQAFYRHRLNRHASNSDSSLGADGEPAPRESQAALLQIVTDLQKRIEECENEIAELSRTASEARSQALMKAGESAIIRGKYDKAVKDYETRIALIEKDHAEKAGRLKTELEAARKERERAENAAMFLEQDLRMEAGKTKQARRTLKDSTGNGVKGQAAATTPKKTRVVPFGDGFDEDDVVMVSPSKSRDRSKASTPRQGSKRKRTVGEPSPGIPLPLSEPHPAQPGESVPTEPMQVDSQQDVLVGVGKDDQKFKLLKRLMNHRPSGHRERTFEAFTKFSFPSLPDRLLSSVIYDGISLYRDESNDFSLHFCRILLSLWERCAEESYYSPLHLIIDTLRFVLAFESLEKTASLVEEIVPQLQSSASLVALPPSDPRSHPELRQRINLEECLSLLLAVARSCAHKPEDTTRLWQLVRHEFMNALLMKGQPLPILNLAFQLLATSITPTSFGPISDPQALEPDQQPPAKNQPTSLTILDRLTAHLHEAPVPPPPRPALWTHRLALLHTISSFLRSPTAAAALAAHKLFLGRLITLLNTALATLYTTMARTPLHKTLGRVVNLATRIAYELITGKETRPLVDRRAKLGAVQGAAHAHLVALARIAFVEDDDVQYVSSEEEEDDKLRPSVCRVLEAGIESEVVDMAHTLLDEFLSPEEGEMLMQVFSRKKKSAGEGEEQENNNDSNNRTSSS